MSVGFFAYRELIAHEVLENDAHAGTQGIDRDVNAARNILQSGKAILAGADKLRQHEKTTVGLTGG